MTGRVGRHVAHRGQVPDVVSLSGDVVSGTSDSTLGRMAKAVNRLHHRKL
jgi:hypothetical protein